MENQVSDHDNLEKRIPLPDMHTHSKWCRHSSNEISFIADIANKYQTFVAINEHLSLPESIMNDNYLNVTGVKGFRRSDDEHARVFRQAMGVEQIDDFLDDYKNTVSRIGKHIPIGFEVDYIRGLEKETKAMIYLVHRKADDKSIPINHFSVAVHYYKGESVFSPNAVSAMLKEEGVLNFIKGYFSNAKDAISGGIPGFKPSFIAHPGVIHFSLNNANKNLNMSDDNIRKVFYEEYESLLDKAIENDVAVEINASGYDRPYFHGVNQAKDKELFPYDSPTPHMPDYIMQKAIDKDVKLVIGSDCHHNDQALRHFDEVYEKLLDMGATKVYKIVTHEKVPVNLIQN